MNDVQLGYVKHVDYAAKPIFVGVVENAQTCKHFILNEEFLRDEGRFLQLLDMILYEEGIFGRFVPMEMMQELHVQKLPQVCHSPSGRNYFDEYSKLLSEYRYDNSC